MVLSRKNSLNPRFSATQQRKSTKIPKERKIRRDKLKHIKVKVSKQHKLLTSLLATDRNMYPTDYATMLVVGVIENYDGDLYPEIVYPEQSELFVSVKIPQSIYQDLLVLKEKWGEKFVRRTVHRILIRELEWEELHSGRSFEAAIQSL
ncbi:hypothetical protein ACFSCX_06060 [Bacillus salitolerans]|uniref:Uncharacterized protein n=1 Tax=Bacillus salitolerans TaxID=1437434 RepID=A0ABW4LLR8_9BACI